MDAINFSWNCISMLWNRRNTCVKRNVIGAVNAITSADMALAGIRSKIPPDEVIDAMKEIGDLLPPSLRETSKAGLAVTPTAIKITEDIIK